MTELRRVINNTAISFFGQGVTWLSSFLLTVAYGRFLGDVKFGELYLAFGLVALVGFPVEFSFNQQLTRDVAQAPDKAPRYLASTFLIKMTLWGFLFGALVALSWLLHYDTEERLLVAICGLTLLSSSMSSMLAALYAALQRQVYPVVGNIIERGGAAAVGFLVLRQGAGVEVMALVLLGGSFANLVWQLTWFVRRVGISLSIDVALIRSLLRTSVPFLMAGVLGVLYYRVDVVLLSLFTNAAVVGWYGAAYRLFDTLGFLPNIVITAIMYPIFSKYSISSEASLRKAIEKSANFLLYCGIPVAVALIVAAPNIIGFLYHRSEFTEAVPALRGLAVGLVLTYMNAITIAIITSTNRERRLPIMAGCALVFNLALNLILIPRYQHVGAAVVTSLTELVVLVVTVALIPRELIPLRSLPVAAKAAGASALMALVIMLLSDQSLLIIAPAAAVVYVAVSFALGTIPREDVALIYKAVGGKLRRSPAVVPAAQDAQ